MSTKSVGAAGGYPAAAGGGTAADGGSLRACMEEAKLGDVREQAQALLTAASLDGSLAAALRATGDESNGLREQAQSLLGAASIDGSLAAALQPKGGADETDALREQGEGHYRPEGHRGRLWHGGDFGSDTLVETIRRQQLTWAEEHPELLLKWSFPVTRRDGFRVTLRAVDKMERLVSSEFRAAFGELVQSLQPLAVRYICFIYLNYLHPFHTNIKLQGRNLLFLKINETKGETYFWWMPLKDVLDFHKRSAVALDGGVSLNDVQLVQTYEVDGCFAVHCETFASVARSQGRCAHKPRGGNLMSGCEEVCGAVIHLIRNVPLDPTMDRSHEFAAVATSELPALCEKKAKLREKRARKKANQAVKKAEAAVIHQQEKVLEGIAANERRKEGLIRPHESMNSLFKPGNDSCGVAQVTDSEDSDSDG